MPKRLVQWLVVVSKKVFDVYKTKNYTWRMLMVPKPTMETPYPCILVSIRSGGGKVLVRVPSLKAYHEFFQLTAEEESKIAQSLDEANVEATRLEEDMRLLFQKRHLPDGVWLVRTDTGEVIAEAERIIRDGNSNSS